MSNRPETPLLDQVARPADLKQFSDAQLTQLASELRAETVSAVSVTGRIPTFHVPSPES